MPDYETLYHLMVNASEDALAALEAGDAARARRRSRAPRASTPTPTTQVWIADPQYFFRQHHIISLDKPRKMLYNLSDYGALSALAALPAEK